MWFSFIVFFYVGANPNVEMDPGTPIQTILMRGYRSEELCSENWVMDAAVLDMMYPDLRGEDYELSGNCLEAHPRLGRYTKLRTD